MLFAFISSSAAAHPGKTDRQDGHKCLQNCGEWNLYHAEYHLHDKDRNPIRVERKKHIKKPARASKKESTSPAHEDRNLPLPVLQQTGEQEVSKPGQRLPQEYSRPEPDRCMLTLYDLILLGAAGFLLLVMLVLRIRKRRNEGG